MGVLSGNKAEVVLRLRAELDKLFDELNNDDKVDVSIEMGIMEVESKDGCVQWEPLPNCKTIIIKTNGGAVEYRR